MTAVHNAKSHFAVDGASLTAQPLGGATVVAATGEFDASNIHHLTDFVRSYANGQPLVLDLTRLDFLGAQGIRSLFAIADEHQESRTEWALVPGHPVSRLLRICDTEARLPVIPSIDEALEHFSAQKRAGRLLQLVTKSG
jgi:anti-anti-sigma factor